MTGEMTARKVQRQPSNTARLLLYGIVLAVCWSPRIRLDALPGGDLRVQDLLLVAALGYLILTTAPTVKPRWDQVWGHALPLFVYVATLTTVVQLVIDPSVPLPVRVVHLGRVVEYFVLAIAVCGLYLRAVVSYRQVARLLRIGIWANLAWIAYQYATGERRTLLGGEVGELIGSYGPKLIGEPSAFGTGVFLLFAAALTVTDHRMGVTRLPATLATLGAIIAAAFLVESRINLFVILASLFLLGRHRERKFVNPFTVSGLVVVGFFAISLWGGQLTGRLSTTGLSRGLKVRLEIWQLMAEYAGPRLLIGVGPGGLDAPGLEWDEGHNILIRAWLDFGVVGAVLFFMTIGLALRAALRSTSPGVPSDGLRWTATLASIFTLGSLAIGVAQDALTVVTSTHLLMVTIGLFVAEFSREQARRAAVAHPEKPVLATQR